MQPSQDFKRVSKQRNPESLLQPVIIKKHVNPAIFFFSFFSFSSHSLFWYAHARARKPAKGLIHDSNISVRKLMKGTFVCMGQRIASEMQTL